MPKEIYNQTDFSGGINGLDSPRDVLDTQVIRAQSVTFDEKGRIRMMGKAIITPTTPGTTTLYSNGFLSGTSLFYFTHDYEMISINSTLLVDPSEKESEYYAYSNMNHISIWQGPSPNNWSNTLIYLGGSPADADRIAQFYFADAALRCYNAAISNQVVSRWHGHIKRGLFRNSTGQINLNHWYTTTTKLLAPDTATFTNATLGATPGRYFYVDAAGANTAVPGDGKLIITLDDQGTDGTWLAESYPIYLSYIYDDSQESPVTKISATDMSIAEGKSLYIAITIEYLIANGQSTTFNSRITGGRLYYSDPADGNGIKYHLLDINFIKGCRKFDEADWTDWWHEGSNGYECPRYAIGTDAAAQPQYRFKFEDMPKSVTYDMLNGYGPTEITDAQFKCHTVFNNRVWAGNIKQDGKTYPDRIIRSPINFEGNPQYDTFPATHKMDVAANDGDAVKALEGFGDRLLVFKKQSVYVINVAKDGTEFVEAKFSDLGVMGPSQVTTTEYGVVWINDKGCYLYTGKEQPINIIENIFSSKDGRQITPDMKWHIDESKHPSVVYLPRDNKLLISLGMAAGHSNNIYLYDFVNKAMSFGSGVLGNYNLNRTNLIVNAKGEGLFAELLQPSGTTNTINIYKWNDISQAQSNFRLWFKDIDMKQPNIRKKFYKMYLSFRAGSDSNVIAKFTRNGNYAETLDFKTLADSIDVNDMLTSSSSYQNIVPNGDFTSGAGTAGGFSANDSGTQFYDTSWYTINHEENATQSSCAISLSGDVSMSWMNTYSRQDIIVYAPITVVDTTTYEVSFTAQTDSELIVGGYTAGQLTHAPIMCFVTEANTATIGSVTHLGLRDPTKVKGFSVSELSGTYSFSFTATAGATWYIAFRSVKIPYREVMPDPEVFASWESSKTSNEPIIAHPYQNTVSNASVQQFDDWSRAELKPTTSSQANNIYSVGLRLDTKTGGTVPSDFEIDNLSIVYRKKNIK